MPPEIYSRRVESSSPEKETITFDLLVEAASARFLRQPFTIYSVGSGERYTSAMTIEGAVFLTLLETGIAEDPLVVRNLCTEGAAASLNVDSSLHTLRELVHREVRRKHPEFGPMTFGRWMIYSNKGPLAS